MRRSLVLFAIAIPLTFAACGGDDEETTGAATGDETATEAATTEDVPSTEAAGTDDESSADAAGTASGPGGMVTISETEFKLDPSDPTTKAGEVTFDVTNDGGTVHDLEVEGDGVEQKTAPIGPGDTARMAVALKPGTYEIYCTIGDHAEQGMEGTLTVQ